MAYQRKLRPDRPVLAICYDFDKTLSPDDMQAQGFIQDTGYTVDDFWAASNRLETEQGVEPTLAYMLQMLMAARGKMTLTRQLLRKYGETITLFPGVVGWFDRIRRYGEEYGIQVEHYIISSGQKEMILGTEPGRKGEFEEIYASTFYFDEQDVAVWPASMVNFTNKTQYLFRIEKGVPSPCDPAVNDAFSQEELRVPFSNMVYIGDSATDVPCMKLVNDRGGYSIGVYDPETGDKSRVRDMLISGRIRYFAPADYREGSELDELLQAILQKTAASSLLEARHRANRKDTVL